MNQEKNIQRSQKFLFISMMCRVGPMVFRIFPISFILFSLLGITHGASWVIGVFINQNLYDALSNCLFHGGAIPTVYWFAVMTCLVVAGQEVLNGLHNFFWDALQKKATGKLSLGIHTKIAKLPALIFEDQKQLDNINKANEGMISAINMFFCFAAIFNFYLPYLIFLFAYLYGIKPLLAISLLVIFVPTLLSHIIRAKIFSKLENESAPIRRENDHYEKCLCSRESMKETRLLGGFKFFYKLYMDTLKLLSLKEWSAEKRNGLINLGLNSLQLTGFLGVYYLLFIALMSGDVSVGVFAAVFYSVQRTFEMMSEVMSHVENGIMKNLGKVKNYIEFLDIPFFEGISDEPDFSNGIVIDNVSFTYPYANKPSLHEISLNIGEGKTLALVGENGSGKTTLIKILTGLYKPITGNVYVAGLDVNESSDQSIFSKTSGVFQHYMKYALTLAENIQISDFTSNNEVESVLASTDVNTKDINTFPDSVNTILSREFGGVDLSSGQWQRVAIARGLYRKHKFIILDEPTAAIDPIEETKIYKQFKELTKGATSIIVTHRLGSARIADLIAVMENGSIVEIGTHESLVKSNGKYAQMWLAQAQYYQ